MTIKQHGGIFGRNPTFNEIGGTLTTAAQPNITSLGTQVANLAFASGNGIDFSATAGTGTSELFDDYEEGAWTPVLRFGGASASLSYYPGGWPVGRYTKNGNTVYAYFDVRILNKGTSTGDMTIEGLPFATGSTGRQGGSLHFYANSGSNWENNQAVYAESSTTVIKLGYANAGNTAAHTDADVSNYGVYTGFVIYNV